MIDIHCHSKHCPHARGGIEEYVNVAFGTRGIRIIGFSEHFPLPKGFIDPAGDSAMKPESLEEYLNDIRVLKNPNVLAGIEVDFIPEYAKDIIKRLQKERFDYIIGSIHFIDGWGFDFSEEVFKEGLKKNFNGNIEKCISSYFSLLQDLIKLDIIDIVGHIDLIKKFNKDNRYFSEENPIYIKKVEETLELVKEKDLIIEVNTAGIDKTVGDIYPSRAILEMCHDIGIKLTLGSDAHKPEQVGRYFDSAITRIKDAGYKEIYYKKNRKTTIFKL